MPNFTARFTGGGNQIPWIDEASNDAPSRQNDDPEHLASYRRIYALGVGFVTVEIRCTVNGVEGPADGTLGGDLFVAVWKEWSGTSPPPIIQIPGFTSVITFDVEQQHVGHFCMVIRRPSGGAVFMHCDVEILA
jgi:hypothetical protein